MKAEILADLYGLRAGLSLISQKIDEKKRCKDAIFNSRRSIVTQGGEAMLDERALQAELSTEKAISKDFQRAQMALANAEEAYETATSEYMQRGAMSSQEKRSRANPGRTMQGFWGCYRNIWVVILIPMMLLGRIVPGFLATFVVALVLDVLFFITIRPFIKIKRDKEAIRKNVWETDVAYRENVQNAYDRLQRAKERVSKVANQLEAQQDRVAAFQRNYQNRLNQNNVAEKNIQQQIAGYERQGNRLYQEVLLIENRLDKVYASRISKADWENIDLLIHYFETGRADSMKEALQLVDRQRQTNQITNAIYSAGRYVGQSIGYSMRELGNALSRSFSVISQQLSGIQQEVAGINDRMNNFSRLATQSAVFNAQGYQKIEQNLTMQIKALDLQNALLEKANVSSDKMVRELQDLKRGY